MQPSSWSGWQCCSPARGLRYTLLFGQAHLGDCGNAALRRVGCAGI
ncbi:MAG TPA: hypothetical protein PLE99_10335 [Candidatus Thiothrix moscowensis]|nr:MULTISPECIES: hypothetical protein [unclassified Thiothrix]HRJ53158.1 hypothetical protein [Candidatus Thiothrix moscowensis]HRJ93272.1 hypothetical protein [Candidatus Thiothrix moscowensis]